MTPLAPPDRSGGSPRRTFRALHNRNFRLFFTGQLISQAGTWLTMIALVLLVLDRTNSGAAVGLLTACQFAPVLLLGAYGGLVADRSDKRRLLVITQTLQMLQSFALAALAFLPHAPLPAFYLTALAGGFILTMDNPARRSFVSEMVPPDEVQNAVTLNTALMTSARIVGPALAGVLVVTTGYGWCFTIDAISYLAVIASLLMMRRDELFQPPRVERAKGQLRAGLHYVRQVPALWIPLAMVTVVGTLSFNLSVTIPLFVEHTLGGSTESFTFLYSLLSVGSLVGALVAARMRRIDTVHVAWASLAFGVSLAVFGLMPSLAFAFPAGMAVGAASTTFLTATGASLQLASDPSMRGRVLALHTILMIGTTPIGGPLLGWICDAFGVRVGIGIGAVAALAAGAWGLGAVRRFMSDQADVSPLDERDVATPATGAGAIADARSA